MNGPNAISIVGCCPMGTALVPRPTTLIYRIATSASTRSRTVRNTS